MVGETSLSAYWIFALEAVVLALAVLMALMKLM